MTIQFFTKTEIEAATRELETSGVVPGMLDARAALTVTASLALRHERKDLSQAAKRLAQALRGHVDAFLRLAADYKFPVPDLAAYGATVVRGQVCASTTEEVIGAREALLRYLVAEYQLDEPSPEVTRDALEAQVRELTARVKELETAETERQERIAELEELRQRSVDEHFRILDTIAQTPEVFRAQAEAYAARVVGGGEH